MIDNCVKYLSNGDKIVRYDGVIYDSISEASEVLHPDYWKDIPVGCMMVLDNGAKKLIRYEDNLMLIRVNGSRHFVQIGKDNLMLV